MAKLETCSAGELGSGISNHDEEEKGDVFLDDSDIIEEFLLDDEDLPDADADADDNESDNEAVSEGMSETDDAIDIFAHGTDPMYAVACNPKDATLVASGGGASLAWFWRIGCEDSVNELEGHTDTISCLSFSEDGQLLASGGVDACVKIWDLSGNLKSMFEGSAKQYEFDWVRWHPSAHLVLAGCTDKTVWLWNADKGACINVFCGHGDHVTCGGFTPNGKSICTGSLDATLRIWNPRSGQGNIVQGYREASALTCLSYTFDSTLALTGSENGFLSVVNIARGKVISSFSSHSGAIECIGVSKSMPWVATGGVDQKLVIFDLQHSASRSIFEYQDGVTCLEWLGGESTYVASACGDGQIIISDARSEENVRSFKGHSERIQQLAVSADNNYLVSASEDGTCRVFDISEFK